MASCRIPVKVQPRARRNEVVGFQGDTLRVRVTAPPDRGRANQAVVELLAESLGIAKREVALVRGAASREKLVAVEGLALGHNAAAAKASGRGLRRSPVAG